MRTVEFLDGYQKSYIVFFRSSICLARSNSDARLCATMWHKHYYLSLSDSRELRANRARIQFRRDIHIFFFFLKLLKVVSETRPIRRFSRVLLGIRSCLHIVKLIGYDFRARIH